MNWFSRKKWEDEASEELLFHIEQQTAANIAAGMTPEEARRQAVLQLGAIEGVKESCREQRRGFWLETLWADLRYGLRMMLRSPGFTLIAILTLALGIGANTAIFSVVEGVLLAPLPYADPDRLVAVWEYNRTMKHIISVSYPDFLDWQRTSRSFDQIAALSVEGYDLTSPGTPEHLAGGQISAGFFRTLGVKLASGREFSTQEDRAGGAPVVIINDRLRRERFAPGSDPLGQSVVLSGVVYTIVGVAPSGFQIIDNADVFTPIGQVDPLVSNDRTIHPGIYTFARLKPDVTLSQAQSEMSAVQENLDQLYPSQEHGLGIQIDPLKQVLVGDVRGTLLLLLGAVALVLLIACANVANLLLARSAARSREFALRFALGARRARVVRQLITESLLLSVAGGALGLILAKPALHAVLRAAPGGLPRSENIDVNAPVLVFTFLVSLAAGFLFGLVPALRSSKTDLQASLKEGGRGSTAAHHRAQSSLVVVQVAVALVILVGAGLLFRTIQRLVQADPGFATQHILTFKAGISPAAAGSPSSQRIAFQQLTERLRQIPGVEAADISALVPLSQLHNAGPFWIGSQAPTSVAEAPRATYYWTGPDYLRVMRIPLVRGRFFNSEDTLRSERVVVIDRALARTFFPDKDPLGQTLTIPHWGSARIIGVAGHVSHWDLGNSNRYTQNQLYASLYQLPDPWVPLMFPDVSVIVRSPLETAALLAAVKAAVYSAGSDRTIYDVRTMEAMASASLSPQRLPMMLLGAFAGLALVLASIGIYGVISYSVAQRVHEIGIRMALGAERRKVFQLVIGQGLRLALAGIAIGSATTLVLTRVVSSFSQLLYGVSATDPATIVAVSLLLAAVAVLACYLPARRAMNVDPIVALRYE
ncbi:MAG TPA: ABC transporter permease [Candidatus Sulfotelmatobacter sp.]|nr:ABC transporter permease [Candidatus Sulfotelmatobacter sp.]